VTGECRKLHNEGLHNLYSSTDITRQIKSVRMRWAWHVACMGEERKVYKGLVGNPEGERHSEDQGVDGRMGSDWILGRLAVGVVDWIPLAQDRDRWRAAESTVMNLHVLAPRSCYTSSG
jgi:hypothetical protein